MSSYFRSMFQTWVSALSKRSEQVFEAERLNPAATLRTALVWMFLAAVVSSILDTLYTLLIPSSWPWLERDAASEFAPPELLSFLAGTPSDRSPALLLWGVIGTLLFFCTVVGIQHLLASAWSSARIRLEPTGEQRKGKFGRYAYLYAAFSAPIAIIASVVRFVPIVGVLIGIVLLFYELRLSYLAIRVEYGVSTGNAILVALTPLFFVFVILITAVFGFFSGASPAFVAAIIVPILSAMQS